MKRLLLTAALFFAVTGMAAAQSKTTVTKDGKTFTASKTVKGDSGNGYTPTSYIYIDTDGVAYEIHTHTVQRGEHAGETRCYIRRVSKKTGKPYWKQIPVKPEELKEN